MAETGDILRLRSFRSYGDDGFSYVEYAANEKNTKKADQKVFIAVLLAVEPQAISDQTQRADADTILASLCPRCEERRQEDMEASEKE
jgi:hypothetical protein